MSLEELLEQAVERGVARAITELGDPLRPASFKVSDAAVVLGIGESTIAHLIRNGHLEAVQFEGMTERRITRAAIDDYLARATPVATTELRSVS